MAYSTKVDRIPFGNDTGVANAYIVAIPELTPAVLVDGFTFEMKVLNSNLGISTLNASGTGIKPFVDPDLNGLAADTVEGGSVYIIAYNLAIPGGGWQVLGLSQSGGPQLWIPGQAGTESLRQVNTIFPNTASADYALSEGQNTTASGIAAHAEGINTTASHYGAHAEGQITNAQGDAAHAEGNRTQATGDFSHAEGFITTASGHYSHSQGNSTVASGFYSHAEGNQTEAANSGSHAEGLNTRATGQAAHAEGESTNPGVTGIASGYASHSEGYNTQATDFASHAEGSDTIASAGSAHAEGANTIASGPGSHAEGSDSRAVNSMAHAEGSSTLASGQFSHSEGIDTEASGDGAHSQGRSSLAYHINEDAQASGKFINRGDSQRMVDVLRAVTTDNSLTYLTLDGNFPGVNLTIPDQTVWKFTVDIVAIAGNGGSLGRQLQGVIKRIGGITTVLSGADQILPAGVYDISSSQELGLLPTSNAYIYPLGSNVSNALIIAVNGENGVPIRWTASAEIVQVQLDPS
jgi:hypothetical protein